MKEIDQFLKDHPGVAPSPGNVLFGRTFTYITPDEYVALMGGKLPAQHTLKGLIQSAKRADRGGYVCQNCETEIWHLVEEAGMDMCFTCITGESDPSEDFELTMNPQKQPHYIKE